MGSTVFSLRPTKGLVLSNEMGARRFKYTKKSGDKPDEYWISKTDFKEFNSSFLGLGDLSKNGKSLDALAAIFDLQGFTSFCDQRDAHLEVPKYIRSFIDWIFDRISKESLNEEEAKERLGRQFILWFELPFFAKFLGDGVLFLWDAGSLTPEAKWNIVRSLEAICIDYERDFLAQIEGEFTSPPGRLRCGVARGQVTSIGNEQDFVGLCINVAARLQKLEGVQQGVHFSFAFTKKGFPLQSSDESFGEHFRLIKIPLRGVEKEELVYVPKAEYNALTKEDQKRFSP